MSLPGGEMAARPLQIRLDYGLLRLYVFKR